MLSWTFEPNIYIFYIRNMLRECEWPNRKIEKHSNHYPIVLLSWLETLCPYIKTNVNCIITEVMTHDWSGCPRKQQSFFFWENSKVRQNNMIKSSIKVKLYTCTDLSKKSKVIHVQMYFFFLTNDKLFIYLFFLRFYVFIYSNQMIN